MPGLQVSTSYRVDAGQTISFTDTEGLLVQASTPSVTLAGSLLVRSPSPTGDTVAIFVGGYAAGDVGPAIIIDQSGLVRAEARDATALTGYLDRPPDVVNRGTIQAVGGDSGAWGIKDVGGINNSGVIETTSHNISTGVTFSLHFNNSGLISVSGDAAAFGVRANEFGYGFTFTNTGTIVAHDQSDVNQSVGVYWGGNSPFVNDGRIESDIALKAGTPSVLDPLTPNSFTNNGVMVGAVDVSSRFARFTNNGEIQGAVTLGSGNDTFSGTSGSATGMVSAGNGDDSLAGGSGFDNFQGNAGNDTESGGDGDDWVVGGKDSDSLSGDAGADLVYGNIGNDTCDGGAGNDIVRGGQDNDSLNGGAGDDFISGDRGNDTVMGGAGADIFHTFGDAGIDRVLDFHASEGDRVLLDPGTQYAVAQLGADTVISMTGGAQMTLIGVTLSTLPDGWIFGA